MSAVPSDWKNKLFFGDNLEVLREHVANESVDLIYLDPPFNSDATYNILFKDKTGEKSAAQIMAFEDTWRWGMESEKAFREVVTTSSGDLSNLLQSFRAFLGTNDMMAYLTMMAIRLGELQHVLKPTGTLYLHCDPTASHYLKILLDAMFGVRNYRNEIVWCYAGGGIPRKDFPRKHDSIFRYTKSDRYVYHPVFRPYTPGTLQRGRTKVKGKYAEAGLRPEGTPVNDWWTDVAKITSPTDPEKLGFQTQKPEALLDRVIRTSSNEGDLVLDPFCGCGTTVTVAERLNRRWVGIDITYPAIDLIIQRLHNAFEFKPSPSRDSPVKVSDLSPYEVFGIPKDLEGARALAELSRYRFEGWVRGKIGGIPARDKRGADRGIDGLIPFFDDESGKAKKIVVQIKSGQVSVRDVRELISVVSREKALIGVLITLNEPTRPMIEEAVGVGFYEPEHFKGREYPRLQILTVEDVLKGKRVQHPEVAPNAVFKRAARKLKGAQPEQGSII